MMMIAQILWATEIFSFNFCLCDKLIVYIDFTLFIQKIQLFVAFKKIIYW